MKTSDQIEGLLFTWVLEGGKRLIYSLCSIFLPKVAFSAVWESLGKEEVELFEAWREAAQNSQSPGMPAIVEVALQPRFAWLSAVTSVAGDVKHL